MKSPETATRQSERRFARRQIVGVVCAVAVVVLAVMVWPHFADHLPHLSQTMVHDFVGRAGAAGPLALIGLMILAVVVSPIPSGPIAIAAGALYGPFWGAIFAIVGGYLGALCAFGIARYLGYDAVRKSENRVLKYIVAPRSRRALMIVVFASRLIPFISFDAVSYGAGLTSLSVWYFSLATIVGIVPICFVLAALGAGLVGADNNWLPLIALCGSITLLPFVVRWVWVTVRAARN